MQASGGDYVMDGCQKKGQCQGCGGEKNSGRHMGDRPWDRFVFPCVLFKLLLGVKNIVIGDKNIIQSVRACINDSPDGLGSQDHQNKIGLLSAVFIVYTACENRFHFFLAGYDYFRL